MGEIPSYEVSQKSVGRWGGGGEKAEGKGGREEVEISNKLKK